MDNSEGESTSPSSGVVRPRPSPAQVRSTPRFSKKHVSGAHDVSSPVVPRECHGVRLRPSAKDVFEPRPLRTSAGLRRRAFRDVRVAGRGGQRSDERRSLREADAARPRRRRDRRLGRGALFPRRAVCRYRQPRAEQRTVDRLVPGGRERKSGLPTLLYSSRGRRSQSNAATVMVFVSPSEVDAGTRRPSKRRINCGSASRGRFPKSTSRRTWTLAESPTRSRGPRTATEQKTVLFGSDFATCFERTAQSSPTPQE